MKLAFCSLKRATSLLLKSTVPSATAQCTLPKSPQKIFQEAEDSSSSLKLLIVGFCMYLKSMTLFYKAQEVHWKFYSTEF